jgi:hypothetical protein
VGSANAGPELMVASAPVATAGGAYSIAGSSPAAGAGLGQGTNHDFFGNARSTNGAVAIGAVEVAPLPKPPVLTAINPTTGVLGTANLAVTLTGTSLTGTTVVTVSGTGVTCTVSGTPTATSVAAQCTITGSAGTGARTVTVTTPMGTSNGVTFTVTPPPPNPSLNCPATLFPCVANIASFGFVGNNTTGVTLTFALSNTGGSFVISTIGAANNSGANGNGTYSLAPGGTCAAGNTLAAGASCTIIVRFRSPAGANLTVGTLTVTGSGAGGVGSFQATRPLTGA